MTKCIVVPIDGSPLSERAIPMAAALARYHHATIHIVRVLPPVTPTRLGGVPPTDTAFDLDQQAATQRSLVRMARRIHRATHLEVVPHLRVGEVVDEIDAVAGEVHADLVVMTTHGRGGVSRAWMGSVTESFLRHTRVPVLVSRVRLDLSTAMERGVPFTRIVVAVDGTPESETVIDDICALLPTVPLDLLLVHVVSPAPVVMANLLDGGTMLAIERDYLEPLAARYRNERCTVRTACLNANSAARAIVDLTSQEKADLVALRTHARRGVPRFALGSVADKVLRLSPVPVYVRGPDAETP